MYVPVKDALVCDSNTRMGFAKFFALFFRQLTTYFDYGVSSPLVNLWVFVTNVVEDVIRQCTIARADLVKIEIFVREVLQQVLRDKASRKGLSIPRLFNSM